MAGGTGPSYLGRGVPGKCEETRNLDPDYSENFPIPASFSFLPGPGHK